MSYHYLMKSLHYTLKLNIILHQLLYLFYIKAPMRLLNTYEDRDEAEKAETLITGEKRLASERDSTEVIYNLFGTPSWGNFYKLDMFNLTELQTIIEQRKANPSFDTARHKEIVSMLKYAAKSFDLEIPEHWL